MYRQCLTRMSLTYLGIPLRIGDTVFAPFRLIRALAESRLRTENGHDLRVQWVLRAEFCYRARS